MAQRHMCPSMGAIRRSLAADVCPISSVPSRALSSSAKRLEEQPGNGAPSTSAPTGPPNRRTRAETALRQITNLQNRRLQPGGLAKGNFPSGQMARRTPRDYNQPNFGASNTNANANANAGEPRTASPRMAKFAARPTTTHGSSPPEGGRMVRAPGSFTMGRNANATVGGARGGPNLRGRAGGKGGAKGSKSREQGPKKRGKKDDGDSAAQPTTIAEVDPATTLSDGMVHQLLRLQRKEWDRVQYEPKYTQGSFEAQQLIHEGRELFRGQAPPVKYWGKLEQRIGLVGMFGAEAHLKVRRVPDGDDAPFGQEDLVESEAPTEEQKREAAVQ